MPRHLKEIRKLEGPEPSFGSGLNELLANVHLINLSVNEMQEMFEKYEINEWNEEKGRIECAHTHTITTSRLLAIIRWYEKKLID